jgi:hypothetical protein
MALSTRWRGCGQRLARYSRGSAETEKPLEQGLFASASPSATETPTDTRDGLLGTAWWNGLTDSERAHWAALVGTGVAADAWEAFKNGVVIRETPPSR